MTAGRLTMNDAQIAQILLTIAEHQSRLADPAYSKKMREDLMKLPDDVAAQMAAAQSVIAQGNALKAELKKQEDEANDRLKQRENAVKVREAAVEQHKMLKSEAEAAEVRAKAVREENKAKEAQLLATSKQHESTTKKHQDTLKEIEASRAKLAVENTALEAKRKEIADYEREVNETASQMATLVKAKVRK